MDTKTAIKQVALSLFARRKKWIGLTTLAALALLLPAAYVLSKEPPRYRTSSTILIENKADRAPVFQEFTPVRPLPVQLAILQGRLLAASVTEALPKSGGGVQIPGKSTETAQGLSQIETTLAEVQANRNISQSRLTALKSKLESMPASPVAARPAAPTINPATAARLRAKLSSLEAQMVEARARYSDDQPRVRSLAQQIADVQRELGDAGKDSVASNPGVGSIPADDRGAVAEMLGALETSVVSLTAQEGALRDQANALRRDLSGLSKDELEFRRLASEVETNRKLSTLLSDKLGAARIREQGEMNVVKVIDPPGFPSTAPNQRRMQFVGLAIALALVLGLGAPATAGYVNRPIIREIDAKCLTGLPLLATIPRVESQHPTFAGNGAGHGHHQDYQLFVDAFRRLRVELQMLGTDQPLRRILID